jgi:hypothetical protein
MATDGQLPVRARAPRFPALPDNLRPAEITGADMPALGIDPAKP